MEYQVEDFYSKYTQDSKDKDEGKIFDIWKNRPTEFREGSPFKKIIKLIIITLILYLLLNSLKSINWILFIMIEITTIVIYTVVLIEELKTYIIEQIDENYYKINFFPHTLFFFNSKRKNILYIADLKRKKLHGLSVFKITGAPENIKANVYSLLRKFYYNNVQFAYQIGFKPKLTNIVEDEVLKKRIQFEAILAKMKNKKEIDKQVFAEFKEFIPDLESKSELYEIELTFTFTETRTIGLDIEATIMDIEERLMKYEKIISGVFTTKYTHFKIENEVGDLLIRSIQSKFGHAVSKRKIINKKQLGEITNSPNGYNNNSNNNNSNNNNNKNKDKKFSSGFLSSKKIKQFGISYLNPLTIKKVIFSFFIAITSGIWIGSISLIPKIYSILIAVSYFLLYIIYIFVWQMRDFIILNNLLQTSNQNNLDREFFDIYEDTEFRRYNNYPNIIFAFNKKLNLLFAINSMIISNLPNFFKFNGRDFIRIATSSSERVPFTYSLFAKPYPTQSFLIKNFRNLTTEEQDKLAPMIEIRHKDKKTGREWTERKRSKIKLNIRNRWMGLRGGIFDTTHIIEPFVYIKTLNPNISEINYLANKIEQNNQQVLSIFLISVENIKVTKFEHYKNHSRIFISNQVRIPNYLVFNKYLMKIPIQSKILAEFIQIQHEFKKSIPSYLPFEFKNPTNIYSPIVFARAYNTQVCKVEGNIGLTEDQLYKGLAIMGSKYDIINVWTLRILLSLLTNQIPFIVIDISGNYKALWGSIRSTPYKNKVLFLEAGKNFSMNLLDSECPNKDYETDYINQILDSIEIAYELSKVQKSIIFNGITELKASSSQPLEITRILPVISTQTSNYSKDEFQSLITLLFKLQYDANINVFRVGNPKMLSKLFYSNKSIILDLSKLNFKERILAQMVFLIKLNHFARVYKEINPIPKKVLVFYEPTEILYSIPNTKINPYEMHFKLLENLKDHGLGIIIQCTNITRISEYIERIAESFLALRSVGVKEDYILRELLALYGAEVIKSNSERRFTRYQEKTLKNLEKFWAVLKRVDQNFPFLIELDMNQLKKLKPMTQFEYNQYLANSEFNFNNIEKELLQKAQKTQLEKDFANFSIYIPQIINFFDEFIQTVDLDNYGDILGLSYNKAVNMMKNHLDNVILKNVGDIKKVKEIRKNILEKCIQHGYLQADYKSALGKSTNSVRKLKLTDKVKSAIDEYQSKQDFILATQFSTKEPEYDTQFTDLKNENIDHGFLINHSSLNKNPDDDFDNFDNFNNFDDFDDFDMNFVLNDNNNHPNANLEYNSSHFKLNPVKQKNGTNISISNISNTSNRLSVANNSNIDKKIDDLLDYTPLNEYLNTIKQSKNTQSKADFALISHDNDYDSEFKINNIPNYNLEEINIEKNKQKNDFEKLYEKINQMEDDNL
ncbi:MAG: hypothetical protein ACTSRZ_13985 [Promethearchaeota archaeon]